MRKINLQLFASVVDVFKEKGMDSSFDARKKYYEEHYGGTYTGTAEQNLYMAEQVKNASAPSAQSAPSTSSAPSNANSGGASKASTQLPVTGNGTQLAQSALSKTFTPSASYQQAMNLCDSLLAQITSGKTSYSDQVKEQMDKILNREDFKYDADSDMLFQQYLASSMATGKQAMQDTMGQAAALTGGYGSTYATSAGNQMYNAYIQDAYANLPEYYQLALEAYQMEGQEMYNQLAMLNEADATEYGRIYNAWNANSSNAQQMYQNEYGQWADEVSNEFNLAQFVNSNYWNEKDNDYKYASLEQSKNEFVQSMTSDSQIDQKHFLGALEAYEKGGINGLNEYNNSLADIYGEEQLKELAAYAASYGEVSLAGRRWTVVSDGKKNWGKGIDNNAKVTDGEKTYSLKELKDALEKEGKSEAEAEAYILKLQEQLKIGD